MELLKKIIIFLVVTFKLFIYIINETIWNSPLVSYIYLVLIFLLSLPYLLHLKFNKQTFIKIFIILIVSFFMFILYKEDNIFLYALVALLSLESNDQELVKTIFKSALIMYVITILLGCLGILPMNDAFRTIDGEVDKRISLGFPNANAVFSYGLPIVLAGIYIYNKKKLFNLIAIVVATILFIFCKSRTGYYLTILALIINYFSKRKHFIKFNGHYFLYFFIASICLAVLFGNHKYNEINLLLSARPWYYLKFLQLGPLVWGFGIPENIILDNLYFHLLANYSVLGFGLYYYIFYKGTKLCQKDQQLLYVSFFFLLYGIFEAITVVNFVLILFIKYLFISYREVKNEKN